MKASAKTIKAFIKDEKQATKTYRKYGFKELSHDEHEHSIFLKNKLKKM